MKGNGDLPVPEYDDINPGVHQLLLSPKKNNAIKLGSVLTFISSAIRFNSELDVLYNGIQKESQTTLMYNVPMHNQH